jgi:hypothetical protein
MQHFIDHCFLRIKSLRPSGNVRKIRIWKKRKNIAWLQILKFINIVMGKFIRKEI